MAHETTPALTLRDENGETIATLAGFRRATDDEINAADATAALNLQIETLGVFHDATWAVWAVRGAL
jgi:hypothetical protein